MLSAMVCVEGIVTKVGLVRPKLQTSVHWCEATTELHVRHYRDLTALVGPPTPAEYTKTDKDNNPLSTEFGFCTYDDHQVVTIQEMPELAPPGQLPRSVEAILEHDLPDSCKAGDRVRVVGIYRAFPSRPRGSKVIDGGSDQRTTFRTRILATSIASLNSESIGSSVFTDLDVQRIREIAATAGPSGHSGELLARLARSIAPSIFGHQHIKKAILLILMSGEEKNLPNGTHLRGDMNLLMVGDPSTAKSQLLRFVLNLAPLAISTSGRGSSGVGLTAAVTVDTETGERRLEAGAMVLADRGVVCIDEFDKMSEEDRVAIHEVMEQQTVTIAKAGIHASLNARCSVIAAANPIYGHYNRLKKPTDNIGLPDSLLSRFDLLFIVLDTMSPEQDRSVAEHVLRMHRYRDRDGTAASSLLDPSFADERRLDSSASSALAATSAAFHSHSSGDQPADPVYQPYNRLLHAHRDKDDPVFSVSFLKKYIVYAKHRIHPTLTEEAREYLTQAFADLRAKEQTKTLPVTPRMMETMIRLSVASARVRLSNLVTKEDAAVAVELINFSLFQDAESLSSSSSSSSSSATLSDDEQENEDSVQDRKRDRLSSDFDSQIARQKRPTPSDPTRKESLRDALNLAMRVENELEFNELLDRMNQNSSSGTSFSASELRSFLTQLEAEGKVMLSDQLVIRL